MKPTKITVPEELKKDVPQTTFGKVLTATPVIMAVIATMLAGLASSEMTKAQYDRSLAAQQQSKAGDQWSFFQAKRLRGAYQQNTAELIQSLTEVHPLNVDALKAISTNADFSTPEAQNAFELLRKGELPAQAKPDTLPPNIQDALKAIETLRTDSEVASNMTKVSQQDLDDALRAAQAQADALDAATAPINGIVDKMDKMFLRRTKLSGGGNEGGPSLRRDFTAARLKYTSMRYEAEARINQGIAGLFELQVRKSNISAERHHKRSQRFFFGMLGAQLAVILSTVAMAARQKNLIWSLAAIAGLLAIAFAIVVYLTM
jgi:hypothetical protein